MRKASKDTKITPIQDGFSGVCLGQPVKLHSDGLFIGPQTFLLFLIMTQTKTGAFPSMGRIPQLFGHAVLASGMLAGGASLLNAGAAMAASSTAPSFPCTAFAPAMPVVAGGFSYTVTPIAGPTNGTGSCTVSSPVSGFDDFVTQDVKFVSELVGPATGVYSYKLTSNNGQPFLAGLIDSDFDLGTGTVQKQVYATEALFNANGATIFDRTSTNGSPSGLQPFTNQSLTEIWVRDTYNVDAGGQLDNFTNTFQTPGPLPILGAGAAFGFSRKLRGRIKAARLG